MKLRNKIHNRAWKEIKIIQNANNFLEVEQAISDAILKTFGLWNIGMKKIRARKAGELEKFDLDNSRRELTFRAWGEVARNMLISYIPDRFRSTIMFQKFITR